MNEQVHQEGLLTE